jgi:hypothetical protein
MKFLGFLVPSKGLSFHRQPVCVGTINYSCIALFAVDVSYCETMLLVNFGLSVDVSSILHKFYPCTVSHDVGQKAQNHLCCLKNGILSLTNSRRC